MAKKSMMTRILLADLPRIVVLGPMSMLKNLKEMDPSRLVYHLRRRQYQRLLGWWTGRSRCWEQHLRLYLWGEAGRSARSTLT